MSTTPSAASKSACKAVLDQLKDDHKRVRKAYREFGRIDVAQDPDACRAIVERALDDLTVHAALEEELIYPAARGEAEDDLLDEAEIEHEAMHAAIDQLRAMSPEDDKYAARFTVLCEYVLHHVKEEEGELFPQLERSTIAWEALVREFDARRDGLLQDTEQGDGSAAVRAAAGRAPRDSRSTKAQASRSTRRSD